MGRTVCRQSQLLTDGEQNGDLMRDPEMIFEAEEVGEELNLVPFLLAE